MSTAANLVYLMYHELELPGRSLCRQEPGYVRYIVRASDFRAQMLSIKGSGRLGMSVSEALSGPVAPGLVVTFDDGCETDLTMAAPLLRELGFNATFYVTVGFLERPGYLSRAQLRELSDSGAEIGSHSMTHAYLSDLNREQLTLEIGGSKQELERITGRPVHHFSCPGGRWNPRVATVANEAGYRSVATSRSATNSPSTNLFALGRVPVMRETSLQKFDALSKGQGLLGIRVRDAARASVKRLLGNTLYDRVRARILEKAPKTR
jgi:peptidoglycan/xylan/chitin deacetylase (PgdA/CDA1 family)